MTMPLSFSSPVGLPAAAPSSGAPASGVAEGFADLVAQLLGVAPDAATVDPGQPGIPAGPGSDEVPAAPAGTDDSSDAEATDVTEPAEPATNPVLDGISAWWAALPGLPLPAPVPVVADPTSGPAAVSSSVLSVEDGGPDGTPPVVAEVASGGEEPSGDTGAAASDLGGSAAPAPVFPPAPAAAPDAGVSLAAVTGPAPVGPTAPAAAAPATETGPVTRQVFPEVVRVAQTGGTQRVTVRLQPEALGEVRVVLTTHRGQLRVSLAADGDAHRALVEGTPELRRLLEAVGGADARIVVRDLPGGTQTGTQTGQQNGQSAARQDGLGDTAGGPAGGTAGGPGNGQSGDDRSAPMHGRTTATDGTPDATSPLRRTESVTGGRTRGLDVTM